MVDLRLLKDRSELSLTRLGARTSFSRSSWERWLNGKQPPPWQAVERMSAVCGGDDVRLAALWEEAARARAARPVEPAPLPKHAVLFLVAACAQETPGLLALWEEVTAG
ncbi:helix-turn-helix domain-containing protein [Micromonospora sp. NPDC002575]|uniref:helix-turn-helix domain-containing protein n=1 Tax=Micromonospora sp. NPDC002575 TaxID=3364222 RepID=UPI0036B2273F